VVYDHHLLREKRWRLRVSEVFKTAEREGVILVTVAEAVGSKPLIDSL
jgi:predicted metallo-beta-lactamase superfamily hydrolase